MLFLSAWNYWLSSGLISGLCQPRFQQGLWTCPSCLSVVHSTMRLVTAANHTLTLTFAIFQSLFLLLTSSSKHLPLLFLLPFFRTWTKVEETTLPMKSTIVVWESTAILFIRFVRSGSRINETVPLKNLNFLLHQPALSPTSHLPYSVPGFHFWARKYYHLI